MKKISVIIPVYKVEKYLDRCLESVVNQTYSNLEIILVDDGSPDRCGEMCDQWAEKDPRITVIHKKNGGLGFARNSGLEVATGDYIAFVDSDDYLDVKMYEKLMKQAEATDSDIVFCGHIKELSNGEKISVSDFKETKVFHESELENLALSFAKPTQQCPNRLILSVWHSIYRKEVAGKFYSEKEVCSEDLPFQLAAMLKSRTVSFIPDALYTWSYNVQSLSHSFDTSKYFKYKKLGEIADGLIDSNHTKRVSDYLIFITAYGVIRDISYAKMSKPEKISAIKEIVYDNFWHSDKINISEHPIYRKIIYKLIKHKHVHGLLLVSNMLKFYVERIVKQGKA